MSYHISGERWNSIGYNHSLAIKKDGTVWTCGLNDKGQLGDGSQNNSSKVIQIIKNGNSETFEKMVGISGGISHSISLKSDGTVWAWGSNDKGQLGTGGTELYYTSPQLVTFPVFQ